MKHNVCMNVGINQNGSVFLMPFHIVDGILLQYTFGKQVGDFKSIVFENQAGYSKSHLFRLMTNVDDYTYFIEGDKESKIKKILEIFNKHKADKDNIQRKAILFVYERSIDDDTPFFEAFDIKADNATNNTVVEFDELGILVRKPFAAYNLK